MKIYGYVECGAGKRECQDRALIGDTVLAGGYYEAEPEAGNNLLIAVADGVGGNPGGEKASLLAVDCIRVLNRRGTLVPEDIKGLVEMAHKQIVQYGQNVHGFEKMATTLTALVLNETTAVSVHIGNCRLYTYRRYLNTLTKDHTMVAGMVSRGEMTQEEAEKSPLRNVIDACLGGGENDMLSMLEAEMHDELLQNTDNILLTSDGVHDYIGEDDLESILLQDLTAKEICTMIAKRARENGSRDDISIIIADRQNRYGKKNTFVSYEDKK